MKLIIYLVGLVMFSTFVNADQYCLDNSWHLERAFDNKEYHPVQCNCPCRKLNIARGQCTECGHFHFFQPQIIIRRPQAPKTVTGWRKVPSSPCN